jgi:hypothetical protein
VLVGLHGMAYNNEVLLKEEKTRLQSMLPENYPVGIRNHYLRMDAQTLTIMSRIGFVYDSTEYNSEAPRRVNNMWEIPINIMDAGFLSNFKNDMNSLQQKTIQKIEDAKKMDRPFFVINFHDIFFSDGYPDFRKWYKWLIKYFFDSGFQFMNFREAVSTLNEPVAG